MSLTLNCPDVACQGPGSLYQVLPLYRGTDSLFTEVTLCPLSPLRAALITLKAGSEPGIRGCLHPLAHPPEVSSGLPDKLRDAPTAALGQAEPGGHVRGAAPRLPRARPLPSLPLSLTRLPTDFPAGILGKANPLGANGICPNELSESALKHFGKLQEKKYGFDFLEQA